LRGERITGDRVTAEQQFVNRVVGEPIGVVRIGMAAREAEDPLRQQIGQRMLHLARLPLVGEASGQPVDQSIPPFGRLQQDRTAVGTRVRLVEGRHERAITEVGKENSLWYRVGAQRERLRCRTSASTQRLVRRGGVCVSAEIGSFVNYPG
jgi:hypothetical protein